LRPRESCEEPRLLCRRFQTSRQFTALHRVLTASRTHLSQSFFMFSLFRSRVSSLPAIDTFILSWYLHSPRIGPIPVDLAQLPCRLPILRKHSIFLLACITLVACGGGGGGGTSVPTSATITSVTVTSTTATVLPGQTLQLTAHVQGTGPFSSSLSWSVNGSVGGNQATGTIDTTGVYTAPSRSPNPNTVNVTATSTADPTKSGSANIVIGTVPFHITGVSITPASVSLSTTATLQFSDAVQGTGTFDPSVQWSVAGVVGGNSSVGTISPSGLYTAPPTMASSTSINVQVASTIDLAVTATATVSLIQGGPTITQIAPTSADAGAQVQILGNNLGGTTTIYFPGPNGIQIAVPLGNTLGQSQLSASVPPSATSGPL
jgi:hypothetical protein